eukprot:3037764-Amphidinium_carterae.1
MQLGIIGELGIALFNSCDPSEDKYGCALVWCPDFDSLQKCLYHCSFSDILLVEEGLGVDKVLRCLLRVVMSLESVAEGWFLMEKRFNLTSGCSQ